MRLWIADNPLPSRLFRLVEQPLNHRSPPGSSGSLRSRASNACTASHRCEPGSRLAHSPAMAKAVPFACPAWWQGVPAILDRTSSLAAACLRACHTGGTIHAAWSPHVLSRANDVSWPCAWCGEWGECMGGALAGSSGAVPGCRWCAPWPLEAIKPSPARFAFCSFPVRYPVGWLQTQPFERSLKVPNPLGHVERNKVTWGCQASLIPACRPANSQKRECRHAVPCQGWGARAVSSSRPGWLPASPRPARRNRIGIRSEPNSAIWRMFCRG